MEKKGGAFSDSVTEKLSETYFNSPGIPKTRVEKREPRSYELTAISILFILACVWIAFTFIGLQHSDKFTIADFDKELQNALGRDISAQGATMALEPRHKVGYFGQSLRLDYNVADSTKRWNRVIIAINDLDARAFKEIEFFIKGDDKGGPPAIKLELLSPDRLAGCYIKDISNSWLRQNISLAQFNNRVDLAHLVGIGIIFEDWNIGKQSGSVYIDRISLIK